MSDKPEALRLADLIERFRSPDCGYAAAELRRLHAANIDCVNHFNAIKAERDELLEALQGCASLLSCFVGDSEQCLVDARDAISKSNGG